MLLARGNYVELITRPEESYRLRCIFVCDLVNLMNEGAVAPLGAVATKAKALCNFLISALS